MAREKNLDNPSEPSTGRLRRVATEVALIGLLVLLTTKVIYDIASVRDLTFGDETSYMMMASAIPERGLPPAEYCPLYCLWYRGLSLVQPDPVRLYYLSWQLLIGLLVATTYLVCRAVGGTRLLALLAAFVALNSRLLDVWPFSGILASVVVLGGTAAAACCRRWAWSLAVIGCALLLASFVRPECAASFVLFGVVSLAALAWTLWRRPASWRGLVAPVLFVLLLTAGSLRYCGNPLGGSRSFAAFAQHYAVNVVLTRRLPIDPCVHYLDFCRKDFGDATTVTAAWRANPRAVLWHFGINLRGLPAALRDLSGPVFALGTKGQRRLCWILGALLLLGLIGQLRRLACRKATVPGAVPEGGAPASQRRGLLVGMFMFALVLPPTLASCVVIYPCDRYLMTVAVLLFALLAAGLAYLPWGCTWRARLEVPCSLVVVGALLLALTPNRAHGWCLQQRRLPGASSPPPVQRLVCAIRTLPLRGPVTFLDFFGPSTSPYTGLPPRYVPPEQKQGIGFQDFVRRHDVGLVILSPWLLNDVSFRDDPAFKEFAAGGWTDRFSYFPVSGTDFCLAVRNDLLVSR